MAGVATSFPVQTSVQKFKATPISACATCRAESVVVVGGGAGVVVAAGGVGSVVWPWIGLNTSCQDATSRRTAPTRFILLSGEAAVESSYATTSRLVLQKFCR
jgi:hypothetical protein